MHYGRRINYLPNKDRQTKTRKDFCFVPWFGISIEEQITYGENKFLKSDYDTNVV